MKLVRGVNIIVGFAMAISANLKAQETLSFTLKEAQDFAIENSASAENARLDVEAAKKKVWETTAIGLPQVSAEVSYQYILEQPESSDDSTNIFSQLFAGIGMMDYQIGQLHPGQYQSSFEGMEEGGGNASLFNDQTLTITATISQLIFSGEYIVGLQAAKTYLALSENQREKTNLEVKEDIAMAYFSLQTLKENTGYLDSMLVNLNATFKEMKAMNEQGFVESTDVDQIELTVKNVENQKRTLNRQIEILTKLFKIQMGIDAKANVVLTESLSQLIDAYDMDKISQVDFDIKNNIDYKSLQTQEKSMELLLKREKSAYLPTMAGFYQYSHAEYPGADEPPAFEMTVPQIVGVSVSIPIFSSGQRNAKVQQAKIELEKTRNSKYEAEQSIQMAALQAEYDVNNALDKYYTTNYSLELSEKIMNNTTIKYKQGMASSLDLTQANNQYLEAYTNYTQAIMELLSAKIALNKLVNNL